LIVSNAGSSGSPRRRRGTDNLFENGPAVKDVGGGFQQFTTNMKVHKRAYAVATFGSKVTPVVDFDSATCTNATALKSAVGGDAVCSEFKPGIFGL
jgi:hypothetical protein